MKRVRSDGSFVFPARPRTHGRTFWRVVTATKSVRAIGKSAVVAIAAYQWTWLNTFSKVGTDSGWYSDPADANGVHYAHPLVNRSDCYGDGENWIEFDLGRHFKQLEATVSMRDDAQTDARSSFTVIVDGQTVASGDVRLGISKRFNVGVGKGLRLRLQETNPAAGSRACTDGNVVWGNIRVLG